MDASTVTVKQWHLAQRRAGELAIEEERAQSVLDRWAQIFVVEELRKGLGLECSGQDDEAARQRWLTIKRGRNG